MHAIPYEHQWAAAIIAACAAAGAILGAALGAWRHG